jgi:hypothetical protein
VESEAEDEAVLKNGHTKRKIPPKIILYTAGDVEPPADPDLHTSRSLWFTPSPPYPRSSLPGPPPQEVRRSQKKKKKKK